MLSSIISMMGKASTTNKAITPSNPSSVAYLQNLPLSHSDIRRERTEKRRSSAVGWFSNELDRKDDITTVSPARKVQLHSAYCISFCVASTALSPAMALSTLPAGAGSSITIRRPRYIKKIPNAITSGERASFIVARVGLKLVPRDFLRAAYIFVVRRASRPIARKAKIVYLDTTTETNPISPVRTTTCNTAANVTLARWPMTVSVLLLFPSFPPSF
mmetsp:Transcript_30493/g.64792  ORF Transcript_30493/g.64792 Transcript_30493/m.64792 type:complete len:217 (+) Transcript_30493:298-948(+)